MLAYGLQAKGMKYEEQSIPQMIPAVSFSTRPCVHHLTQTVTTTMIL